MCRCRGSRHGAAAGSHSPSQTVSDPAPPATPHVCLSSSWHITYPSLVSESSTLLPQTRPCSLPGKPSARLSIPSTQTHMHMDTIYNIHTLSQAPAAYEHVQVILIWPCSPRRRSWPRAGSRETRPHPLARTSHILNCRAWPPAFGVLNWEPARQCCHVNHAALQRQAGLGHEESLCPVQTVPV